MRMRTQLDTYDAAVAADRALLTSFRTRTGRRRGRQAKAFGAAVAICVFALLWAYARAAR